MNIDLFVKYSNALVTPALALFGSYIAYQQWLTNERKRKQDLFEMRHKYLYSKMIELVKIVPRIAKANLFNNHDEEIDKLFDYARNRLEYGFLLSSGDEKKLKNLYTKIIIAVAEISSKGIENLEKNIAEYEKDTIESFEKEIYDIFDKYMRIENHNFIKRLFPTPFICLKKIYALLCKDFSFVQKLKNFYNYKKAHNSSKLKNKSDTTGQVMQP